MSTQNSQWVFLKRVAGLIRYADEIGVELTGGDLFRDPRVHGAYGDNVGYSSALSKHKLRLAIDFNLFVDGHYIQDSNHEIWNALHDYWELEGGGARIGGDANHFQ